MPTGELRKAYFDVIMQQVRSCRFPSPTMLDRIEQSLADRRHAEQYAYALLDSIAGCDHPSPMMLDRAAALVDRLERAG